MLQGGFASQWLGMYGMPPTSGQSVYNPEHTTTLNKIGALLEK